MFNAASVSALTVGSFGSSRPVMGSGMGAGRFWRFGREVSAAAMLGGGVPVMPGEWVAKARKISIPSCVDE